MLYIVGAYWFTSSTSFANPAVTLARALTNTFAGIAPAHVAGFMVAQAAGAIVAVFVMRVLNGSTQTAPSKTQVYADFEKAMSSDGSAASRRRLCHQPTSCHCPSLNPTRR